MPDPEHKQALPPGHQLGHYRLLKVLGVGGFGVTYLGEHVSLGHRVAVKEYLPNEFAVREGATVHPKSPADQEDFEWGLSRFVDEARTLTRFRHPNLVRVSDYFEANNTAYIVMDYEEGEPLDRLLQRLGTLTERQLMRVLLPVADGLRQVHAAGFLHRDIKPSNVFVRRSDESPVLLDFGSARQALGRKSKSMTAIASAGYSPPEQYESQGAQGPWTDIYALSALCHRAITGETPMEAPRRQSQLLRSQVDPLPRLAEAGVAGYSPAFLEAVDQGLRVIETERPQSLDEWLAQWEDAAATDPPMAPKPRAPSERGEDSAAKPPKASAHSEGRKALGRPGVDKPRRSGAKAAWLAVAAVAAIGVGLYFVPNLAYPPSNLGKGQVPPPVPDSPTAQANSVGEAGGREAELALGGLDGSPVGGGSALLVVETQPAGVEVLIRGEPVGETPLELANLRSGAYGLTLRHPHYETIRLEDQGLADGEVLRVERTLTRGVGKLTVLTTPRNAWVEREGEQLASRTPVTLEGLPAGLLELTLGADEHRTVRVQVEVPKDGLGRLSRILERIARGTLTLELVPADARVTLPDIEPSYSPGMRLPEGRYRVIARREGYADLTREVTVPGNGEARERIELSPLPQSFTVAATPPDASVEILGIAEAYRAGMLLAPGDYQVRVSAPSHEAKEEMVRHGASGPTVHRVELERLLEVGVRFRDCAECPEMVVVPAGSFLMGSPDTEEGRLDQEGPVHRVTIGSPFAVGVYEVTVAEFGLFVDATGHSTGNACYVWTGNIDVEKNGLGWRNPGFGQGGSHPAVCVSWEDAQAYVAYLSRIAGERYRLPSEAEWEYAARAGTRAAHWWGEGESDLCTHANGADASTDFDWAIGCNDGHSYTAPVGSFHANAWGLHDVLGNAWEWTEDCWNGNYRSAPGDGSAWKYGDCNVRVPLQARLRRSAQPHRFPRGPDAHAMNPHLLTLGVQGLAPMGFRGAKPLAGFLHG